MQAWNPLERSFYFRKANIHMYSLLPLMIFKIFQIAILNHCFRLKLQRSKYSLVTSAAPSQGSQVPASSPGISTARWAWDIKMKTLSRSILILQRTFGSLPGAGEPIFLLSLETPFMNSPKALAHLPTKDSLKTHITSNSKHEMKIDAFNFCNKDNRELPEILSSFIFHLSFQE